MMARACALAAVALLLLAGGAEAVGSTASLQMRSRMRLTINPIRRVVNLLGEMQKKVTEEGVKNQELFDKFMCYCKTGGAQLQTAIAEAETKVPRVESSLEAGKAQQEQLKKDLVQHRGDRAEAEDALSKATALREKEAAQYAKDSSDAKTNIAALGKAIAALEKGSLSNFLQTSAAGVVRRLTVDMDLSSTDRDVVAAFLMQGEGQQYSSSSLEILSILKQMKETMEKSLAEATSEEEEAKANYAALTSAKEKEVNANTAAIEDKLRREGQLGVDIETMKADLAGTSKQLVEDKQFIADLGQNCGEKTKEFEAVKMARAEELLAIGDTIKILNADDSLDLFKKALPSPSLLQTGATAKEVKLAALRALRAHRRTHKDVRLDLIALALRGKKVSFEKILSMMDDMVKLLGREQKDDDGKKAYCTAELDKAEDQMKKVALEASDLGKVAEDAEGTAAELAQEIIALTEGIKALDASVAEATALRKSENAAYSEELSTSSAAKEILEAAQSRLSKFYTAAQKPPDASVAELIEVGVAGATAVPGQGPAASEDEAGDEAEGEEEPDFLQVASHGRSRSRRNVPGPPPEAVEAYMKKGEESAGVTQMLHVLMVDLDKEITELKVSEQESQKEYEAFVKDSAGKRSADAKSLEEKEGAKAEVEAEIQKTLLEKKSKVQESLALTGILKNLHLECDWLIANHEVRAEARQQEIDSLQNAKAVLSGADYSFVEVARTRVRGVLARRVL